MQLPRCRQMDDFTRAIGEIKPAFGVSVDQLELCMPNGTARV
jgi:hypothetical protein